MRALPVTLCIKFSFPKCNQQTHHSFTLSFSSATLVEHSLPWSDGEQSWALPDTRNITFGSYEIKATQDYENHISKRHFFSYRLQLLPKTFPRLNTFY